MVSTCQLDKNAGETSGESHKLAQSLVHFRSIRNDFNAPLNGRLFGNEWSADWSGRLQLFTSSHHLLHTTHQLAILENRTS